ncbi:MAG: HAMP domain-containing protein [Pyrinomonadaceae bacterium]|nr:HAMP domain-containing protein [Pyrinomonadaceae bacterium]MBP6212221.1 HAMP domain-containing protein [Pyrinomonadaceae bacterium]
MTFFNTFRGRLLLILAFLLIATLGLQYYLNLRTQRENSLMREAQEQSIVAGIALGFTSMTSPDFRVQDLIDQPEQTFIDKNVRERIRDIIIIDSEWQVADSLNPRLLPSVGNNDEIKYRKLNELTDLPPLMEGARLGSDLKYFPNRKVVTGDENEDEAHAVPIETSKGRWYVMVLLRNDKSETAWRAAQPLVFTLGLLLVSSLITFLLVWRFTRPIADLAGAARKVAEGDLSVRVPEAGRSDEMGRLAWRFNEMTAELEKKRDIEAQLQQAEKSAVVGRLGSAIAHEIRNPLNYINLTLDHLRSKYAPDDEEKRVTFDKLTSQLKDEVARINQQISDFLNYSRPASVNLRPIDARQIIEDSLRIVEAQAAEQNVKIGIVEHENVPQIMGDPEFLRSVFNNLFINAVQAMGHDGGSLSIRISPDDNMVKYEVSDTGNGISADNLSKIFEPYFSTKETGTGLGLAIVHKIVDIHNGTIEVESTEGEGTKFIVKLPNS